MTLKQMLNVAVSIAFVVLVVAAVFLGNQRLVHASQVIDSDEVESDTAIDLVTCQLLQLGPPASIGADQDEADECAGTPPAVTGSLKVMKIVVGGEASPLDFSIHVKGAGVDVSNSPQPGSSAGTTYSNLPVGTYVVSETGGPANYTAGFTGNCDSTGSVTLGSGDTKVCTMTNTFHAPQASSDLSVTKTVDNAAPSQGSNVVFTIKVHNFGPDSATGVTVSDSLPGGLTYVSDDAGTYVPATGVWTVGSVSTTSDATIHITAKVGSTTSAITNTASIASSNSTDSNTENNSGSALITPTSSGGCDGNCGGGTIATTSDLAITKTVDTTAPNIGDAVTYTLTVTDTGKDATGVVVHDALPAGLTFVSTSSSDTVGVYDATSGTWTIGNLASTSSATLHIKATVNSGLTNGTNISNTASITGGDMSSTSTNDSATASLTVTIPTPTTTGDGNPPGGSSNPPPTGNGGNGPPVGSVGGGGNGPVVVTGKVLGAATSTTGLPPGCDALLTTFMRMGKKDNTVAQVKTLQQFFNDTMNTKLPVTGYFGLLTDRAVRAFQKSHPVEVLAPWNLMDPTGFVYKTTQRWINLTHCSSLNIPLPTDLTPYSGQ